MKAGKHMHRRSPLQPLFQVLTVAMVSLILLTHCYEVIPLIDHDLHTDGSPPIDSDGDDSGSPIPDAPDTLPLEDSSTDPDPLDSGTPDIQEDTFVPPEEDTALPPEEDSGILDPDRPPNPLSCDFQYQFQYPMLPLISSRPVSEHSPVPSPADDPDRVYPIVHIEPPPPSTWLMAAGPAKNRNIVMPDYQDNMPLFHRATAWEDPWRCYELPSGAAMLSQDEVYDLYASIIQETLWHEVDRTPNRPSVLGLRGAYPGTFAWNDNRPDRFNDTLVLLWIDTHGKKHVREFPVNTDTGAHNFGDNGSSSLRPNRRYEYKNGWHRQYNALSINTPSYPVRDDTNKNGHWDSDRNGWLPPSTQDRDRNGFAHNIHMGSMNAPLENAQVGSWSAGCQVIPGMANWTEFIAHAWTNMGDLVSYYLIDVRDIAPEHWEPCGANKEGTHGCPHRITSFPYQHQGDTSQSNERWYDDYNCSPANESGPEVVYVLNVRRSGTLTATVSVTDDTRYDPDIYLLDGDDRNACRARAHITLTHNLPPGRFVLIVDTWVNESGVEMAGPYTLDVNFN